LSTKGSKTAQGGKREKGRKMGGEKVLGGVGAPEKASGREPLKNIGTRKKKGVSQNGPKKKKTGGGNPCKRDPKKAPLCKARKAFTWWQGFR